MIAAPDRRAPSATSQLAWLSLAMFLGMTLWFSATATNAAIVAEFHLTSAETAWLTMAVQGGFVIGTLGSAMLNLPDVFNVRRLFTTVLIALRAATGAALACVYPPGMKVAAGWFEQRRGTALGILIGALTIGSAFPHLLAALSAAMAWRTLMIVASTLAVAGGALVAAFVGDGPYVTSAARFDPRAVIRVFSDRGTRLATLGYLGHMWELYSVWTWIAAFVTAGLGVGSDGIGASTQGSALAFITIASGAAGSVAAGVLADRIGQARIAAWAMLASGACCALAGVLYAAPVAVMAIFVAVWGIVVVADSAQLSALVARYSPRDHVGTALTVQMCAGFLLTMASIRLLPLVADAAGWRWTFLVLAPGPLLGALALRGLRD